MKYEHRDPWLICPHPLCRCGRRAACILAVIMTALVVVVMFVGRAHAEMQMLYLNLDNRSWTATQTFIDQDECDKAARRAMREHKALGAGCTKYIPDAEVKWQGQADDGYRTKEQQMIDDRQQKYDNRREHYERQFRQPTPSMMGR